MREARVTGLTCVPPLWLQLVAVDVARRGRGGLRYFANTGGRMPEHTLRPAARALPAGAALT